MFLLILCLVSLDSSMRLDFTFHYVSINTLAGHGSGTPSTNFTFHYVSINTYKLY